MKVIWQAEPCTHDDDEHLEISVPAVYSGVCFTYCTTCEVGWHKFEDPGLQKLVEKVVSEQEMQLRYTDK